MHSNLIAAFSDNGNLLAHFTSCRVTPISFSILSSRCSTLSNAWRSMYWLYFVIMSRVIRRPMPIGFTDASALARTEFVHAILLVLLCAKLVDVEPVACVHKVVIGIVSPLFYGPANWPSLPSCPVRLAASQLTRAFTLRPFRDSIKRKDVIVSFKIIDR